MLLIKLKLKSNFFKFDNLNFSNTFISIILFSLKFRISNFSNFKFCNGLISVILFPFKFNSFNLFNSLFETSHILDKPSSPKL